MMDELKACPFCGVDYYEISGPQELGAIVVCNECGASAKSIVDWNTRPIEDALHTRIAELEGLVDELIEAGESMSLAVECENQIEVNAYYSWKELVKDWKERER